MMWTLSKSSRLSISAAAAVVTASFAAALRGKMLHLAGPSPPINITSTSTSQRASYGWRGMFVVLFLMFSLSSGDPGVLLLVDTGGGVAL
uniref:Uncharacterized protein n=1 Tax=Anopheles darlingi TaxID=43151 RepID=A0A2M4DCT6_ANODA